MKYGKMMAAAVAVMLALGGCGQKETANVEKLLETAKETMGKVESIAAELTMQMTMGMPGSESVDSMTRTSIETKQEPLTMKMALSMEMDGQTEVEQMQMYAMEEEGMLKTYILSGDTWQEETMALDALGQYDAEGQMDFYLDCISGAQEEGKEAIGGVDTTKISGVVAKEDMAEAMAVSGLAESALSLGISNDMLADMYDELGEMPLRLWIDDAGYVWKYEMDMTTAMQQIMDLSMAAMGMTEEDTGILIEKTILSAVCESFNEITEIEIPAEILELRGQSAE